MSEENKINYELNNGILTEDIDSRISFPEMEENILKHWDEEDAFKKSIELSIDRPEYTFYDGPPFATGLPHYGHILAGTIKDIVTRYAHQNGHHVVRRAGWDCHGLPVEYEIDQQLGIKDRQQVLDMGIDKYNAECRSIVTRYTSEWEGTVKRLGRWIDFENDYKTMDPSFMESVWWVFKTIFDKELVYMGYKVMPYSTACGTPLSNFEASLNYKDMKDLAITVEFPIISEDERFQSVSFLAWTTTPWTLPSNLALCVHPEFIYIKILDKTTNKLYVLAEERLSHLYPQITKKKWKVEKNIELFEILEKFTGTDLVGIHYQPMFNYFSNWAIEEGRECWRILADTYVTNDSGTGIVHQAPAFGEDDYRVCVANDIIGKGRNIPAPVDVNGKFTSDVTDFIGRYVKEADSDICALIKTMGRLYRKDSYVHSVPFCWRSDTPLIYKVVPSWFISVESIKDDLVKNNEEGTYWVPAFVKEKRFHNWLTDARDWAISRNRFWGTPLPLWISDDFEEVIAIGSIEELHQLSGVLIEDLHRESIDHITIPSKQGKGDLHRVDEVFDCWFESGSMPYAQSHYPFENPEKWENGFPADFIAEGLDQTRGWFYTLMVISTCLFNKPAFKNLIVNGLVLAEDGKKMSKRLKNYPDPIGVINAYGADALRLYLINSPVVRAAPLRFREKGVHGVIRDVFLPWYNAYRFFFQSIRRWEISTGYRFKPNTEMAHTSDNDMDKWIQSSLHHLIEYVHEEMGGYRLYTVVPGLINFLEELTNWYVRLNRNRLKGYDGDEHTFLSLSTLYEVLRDMCILMAPFTPFFTEYLYQGLRKFSSNFDNRNDDNIAEDDYGKSNSVHYLMLPKANHSLIDPISESRMKDMQSIIEGGRVLRENKNISMKYPVKEVIIVCSNEERLNNIKLLSKYIEEELNVFNIQFISEEESWCELTGQCNFKLLGQRFKKELKNIKIGINNLNHDDLINLQTTGKIDINGNELTTEEIVVKRIFKGDESKYVCNVDESGEVLTIVNFIQDDETILHGMTREFIGRVQKLRKKANLSPSDNINIWWHEEELNEESKKANDNIPDHLTILDALKNVDMLRKTFSTAFPHSSSKRPEYATCIIKESTQFGNKELVLELTRPVPILIKEKLNQEYNTHGNDFITGIIQYVSSLNDIPEDQLTFTLNDVEVTLQHSVHYYKSINHMN